MLKVQGLKGKIHLSPGKVVIYKGQLSITYCFSLSFRLMMIPATIPRTTGGTNKEGKRKVKPTIGSRYLTANSFGAGKYISILSYLPMQLGMRTLAGEENNEIGVKNRKAKVWCNYSNSQDF